MSSVSLAPCSETPAPDTTQTPQAAIPPEITPPKPALDTLARKMPIQLAKPLPIPSIAGLAAPTGTSETRVRKPGQLMRRVRSADTLGGAGYSAAGLGAEFDEAIQDMFLCLDIRNQYAHCIWHDPRVGKLAFAHMEEIASPTGLGPDPINLTFKFVNVPLLNHQEQFFFYTRDTLNYRRRQIVGEINADATRRTPTKVGTSKNPRQIAVDLIRWIEWRRPNSSGPRPGLGQCRSLRHSFRY